MLVIAMTNCQKAAAREVRVAGGGGRGAAAVRNRSSRIDGNIARIY
jgi:hypothetical protein